MISFYNPGKLDLEGLVTFGLSSKGAESGKIGRFGTGLKYATAVIMREGGAITIHCGDVEHKITARDMEFRGVKTRRIQLDGKDLAFTTELGRDWEPWMAFRELYSNALDEAGGVTSGAMAPSEDKTVISVDLPAFEAVFDTMDEHFIGLDEQPIWENDDLRVYPGASYFVFYRGIAVLKLKERAAQRYDIRSYVVLSEDRNAKYEWQAREAIAKALVQCDNLSVLEAAVDGRNAFEARLDFSESDVPPPNAEFLGVAAKAGKHCSPSAASVLRENLPDDPGTATVIAKGTPGGAELSEALRLMRVLGADISKVRFLLADGVPMYQDWEVRRGTIFLSQSTFNDQKRMTRAVMQGFAAATSKDWIVNKLIDLASEGAA